MFRNPIIELEIKLINSIRVGIVFSTPRNIVESSARFCFILLTQKTQLNFTDFRTIEWNLLFILSFFIIFQLILPSISHQQTPIFYWLCLTEWPSGNWAHFNWLLIASKSHIMDTFIFNFTNIKCNFKFNKAIIS